MYRRHVLARTRLIVRRLRWFLYHNLLHADDPPEKLARGVAIGMFTAILPIFGFQTLTVLALAWAFRANKVVGLPLVWVSNPFTFIPIYYPAYVLGSLTLGGTPMGIEGFRKLAHPPAGYWEAAKFYWHEVGLIAGPFWLGSTIVGLVLGLLSYYIVFHTIRGYRLRRWGKLIPPTKLRHAPPQVKSHAA